jgi:serine/threonine protein kinase
MHTHARTQVRQYAAELVCVLSHLHDNGVVYVDLKPENVLLQDCGHIMLCDMDLAHTQQEIQHIRDLEAGACCWVCAVWTPVAAAALAHMLAACGCC